MANVIELGAQLHLKMEDGSMVIIQTPPLVPKGGTTVDDIREKIMEFGEDPNALLRARAAEMGADPNDPRIVLARGGLRPFHGE
jgi:hypothetical protein